MTARPKLYRVVAIPESPYDRQARVNAGIREKVAELATRTLVNGGATDRPDPKTKP